MRHSLFALILLAAAAGCSSDASGPPEGPPTLSVLAGDGQFAAPTHTLQLPLVVQATSATGSPLDGWVVKWTVSGGGQVVASHQIDGIPYPSNSTDASGQAQAQWTLGFSGVQQAQATIYYKTVAGMSPVTTTFSATLSSTSPPTQPRPAILHYDGASWTVVYQPAAVGVVNLLSVWGSSPSSIYTVGEYCGVEAFIKYDGTSWSPSVPDAPPGCSAVLGPIRNNVAGSSASNVFSIQTGGGPMTFGSEVQHFDGSNWTNAFGRGCTVTSPSGCTFRLEAVWTDSPNNAVVVGDGGYIAQYNGSSWTPATTGTTVRLRAVWGVASAATPRVFAVGDAGTILTYDGTSWQAQSSGTTQTLRAVWGTSANDVFAVGDAGVILHYDGTTWSTQTVGTRTLYGIWGSSRTSVFAVGDGPTLLYYDGSSWTSKALSIPIDLRAIWGSGPNDIYAVGRGQ